MSALSFGEFVQLMAAQLHQQKVPLPFQDERPWHELFFELKQHAEWRGKAAFLSGLRFDWNGPYPKSQELSSFLHALHCNASTSVSHPGFHTISLPDEIANLWRTKYRTSDIPTEELLQEALKRAKVRFPASMPPSWELMMPS